MLNRRAALVAGGLVFLALGALWLAQLPEAQEAYRTALLWIREQQTLLHQDLQRKVMAVREEGPWALWPLILLSFLYGLFHAAGPGHGKVILSTYLVTQRAALRRGVLLAMLSALMQGVTAVVLVLGLFWVLGLSGRDAQTGARLAEQASYLLVLALGLALAWRAARQLRPSATGAAGSGQDSHCESCGHAHAPDAHQMQTTGLRASLAIIFSIGIRPCSGAIIVLLATEALGLRGAGLLAVLAMSLGTAMAVAGLAALSVGSRALAGRLAALEGQALHHVSGGVALLGGLGIAFLGASLFLASLGPRHPLL